MLQRFFIFSSALFLMMGFKVYSADIKTITDAYASFRKLNSAMDLVATLKGDTISFADFNQEYVTIFKNIKPDTIWLKERPKKRPQEGKHYKLRYLYRSEITEEKGISIEATPVKVLVGTSITL